LISIVPKDDHADVNTSLRRVLVFNAAFIPILVLALGATAYFVQQEFRQLAEQQVLENAHLMMETAKASRVYTTEQIEPLLTHEEARVAQGVKDLNDVLNTQIPQALQQAVSGLPNPKERQTLQILSEQIVQNVKQQPRSVPDPNLLHNRFRSTPLRRPSITSGSGTPTIPIKKPHSTRPTLATEPWNGKPIS
jgi:hypothetical protein